jgi:transcriptional regulator with XRE-family HTH domain
MSTVGENILQMRKRLGWTQEELATRMGYKSKSTINKIELGINDIPQSKIVKFADVLGTTPAHLMGWNDEEESLSPEEPVLSEGEKIMLDLFRRVPEDQQQLVLQMIRAALGSRE